ncbi:hypothetical protein BGZ93_000907 [Podila epicladia]|nr:hypothetical protein BGZ92_001484 [Podila epicladia]KAG0085003.1 hypothetical protein BGZ93_000907 [Podila epicladia]
MPESTQQDNDHSLYPHSTDFEGRPPPPKEGYSWHQITAAIAQNSLHGLRRTDKGQWEYEVWQDQIDRTKYGNIGRYIALTVLHWPDLLDPAETPQAQSGSNDNEALTLQERYRTIAPRLTLRLNHYPFPVQDSIQYFVLWATRDISVEDERERLDRYLEEQFVGPVLEEGQGQKERQPLSAELVPAKPGKKKEWIWFVNPIELRSVATVHHLHVFVRDVDA